MALFDTKEASKYLSVCPEVLMSEIKSGHLVGFKIGGRWRFDQRDLDYYIDAKRRSAALATQVRQHEGKEKQKPIQISSYRGKKISLVWTPGAKIEDVCG